MARENQGLQIALIIFVILTIALAVTTFMFFKQADDLAIREKTAVENADKNKKLADGLADEGKELRKWIGFQENEPIGNVRDAYNKDMQRFDAGYDVKAYRKLVERLHADLQKKNDALTAEQQTVKDLTDKLARFASEKQPQIDKALAAAQQAANDLDARTKQFSDDRSKINQEKEELAAKFDKARKDSQAALAKAQSDLDDMVKRLQRQILISKQRGEQLEQVTRQEFEVAHGKVRWVNQRTGTVWINLGQADNLARRVTFSVYSADTNDVTKAAKKADIEVTQILGEHLAEARVVSDVISDPIMPGDVIYTPLWRPGEKQHLALVGFIDVNGDGRSDLRLVLNLITMNGAEVDLYQDENGKKVGRMSAQTRYLVLGKAPEARIKTDKSAEEVQQTYTAIRKEAEQLGVRTLRLEDLLKLMGFKHETHVVRFGQGANAADFKARLPEGVQRTYPANLSPLYQQPKGPREARPGEVKPPRAAPGSAYD